MAVWYLQILWTHIICVIVSGSLFFTRGCMVLAGIRAANHIVLRYVSVVIDMTLLAAGIILTTIIHQYPFVQAWLTVKVVLLVVYIALGTFALKRGRTPAIRATTFVAACAVYLFIISVARVENPWGIFLAL